MMFFHRNDNDDQNPGAGTPVARVVPLLPLRDIIVFPHMVVPLFVGREKSINALEEAMSQHKEILLAAQKKAKTNDPTPRTSSRSAPSARSSSCCAFPTAR